jgi:hypothetical protein
MKVREHSRYFTAALLVAVVLALFAWTIWQRLG